MMWGFVCLAACLEAHIYTYILLTNKAIKIHPASFASRFGEVGFVRKSVRDLAQAGQVHTVRDLRVSTSPRSSLPAAVLS